MNCPCCGAVMPDIPADKLIYAKGLTDGQSDIVDRLAGAYPEKVNRDRLLEYLYSDHTREEPDTAYQVLRNHISKIRAKIEPLGWTIERGYRLARLVG